MLKTSVGVHMHGSEKLSLSANLKSIFSTSSLKFIYCPHEGVIKLTHLEGAGIAQSVVANQ